MIKTILKSKEDTDNIPYKFYCYHQNNSGGHSIIDDQVGDYVIIEARNSRQANSIAEAQVGIYFDGINRGLDCDCCGDRWSMQYRDADGTEIPQIYGQNIEEFKSKWMDLTAIVYYKNGEKIKYEFKKDNVK